VKTGIVGESEKRCKALGKRTAGLFGSIHVPNYLTSMVRVFVGAIEAFRLFDI